MYECCFILKWFSAIALGDNDKIGVGYYLTYLSITLLCLYQPTGEHKHLVNSQQKIERYVLKENCKRKADDNISVSGH